MNHFNWQIFIFLYYREKSEDIEKLVEAVGSDPDKLETHFEKYFTEEMANRRQGLEEALKQAGAG